MSIKKYSLTRDQVRELCPSCADKMQLARIKELKLSADELGNLLPADESAIKLFVGFSQGLCDKFGADAGFFTRCAEHMAGKVDDENGFCASLKKFCTGHWPAEISKEHEQVEEFGDKVGHEFHGNQYSGGHGSVPDKVKGQPLSKHTAFIGILPRAAGEKDRYHVMVKLPRSSPRGRAPKAVVLGRHTTLESALAHKADLVKAGAKGMSSLEQVDDEVFEFSGDVEVFTDNSDYQEYIDKREDVSPQAGKQRYGDVTFADEKNKKYPIDTEEHIRAAWNYINKGNNAGKYSSEDLATVKGHIVAAWKKTIDKAGPPSAQEQKNNAVAGMKSMTRQEVAAKCPDCAGKMAGNEQDMPVDNGGHMQHICGKGGRATNYSTMNYSTEALAEYVNNIKGVEIFRTGTHNGDAYTTQDLDDMVAAFQTLDYRPAIKIGHSKDQPGAPAYGWVQNVTRDGDKLRADFTDMHDSVVEAIRNKAYDRCSAEIYFNLKRGGKDYRRALKAVALLGAEVPAVANLTPLHKMEFTADAFERVDVLEQALEVPSQALVDALAERVTGLINVMKEYDMAKNTQKIAELKTKVDDLNEQIVALNAAGKHTIKAVGDKFHLMDPAGKKMSEHGTMASAMSAKKDAEDALDQGADEAKENKIAELMQQAETLDAEIEQLEQDGDTEAQIATLQEQLTKANAVAEAHKKETKELSERMAKIESERRNSEVGAKVTACKIPAFRDALSAVYSYALAHAGEVVKVYSKDKDGKDVSADKTLVEAVDGIVTEINAQSEKLFKALAYTGQTVRSDGVVSENAGEEIQQKVTEYRSKHPEVKSYEQAMNAVLKAEPELATRYREQQPGNEQ